MERPLLLFRRDPSVPSLCRFLSHLVDMFRPVEPFIKGHTKITGVVDPLDLLPEELYCSGFWDAPAGFGEEHRGALRDIDGDPPFTQSPFEVAEISLQVFDEEHWLTRRGYDGRIVRIKSQLGVEGRRGHIVHIQAEQDRGNNSTQSYASPHATSGGCGCLEGRFERPSI